MRKSLSFAVFTIYLITLSFLAPDASGQAGGVAINRNNTAADPSAALDVSSTSAPFQGMLIPRMTTANRNLIISPAIGLQVFNIDCGVTEYYTGTCWIPTSQGLKRPSQITCSGSTDFCSGQSRTFTITAITGATNYVWTAPAGSVITGQGSTTVTIVFGQKSGEVCVSAESACETTIDRCLDILINPAPALTGTTPSSICGSGSVTLSAAANSGVVNWYDAATGGTLLGTGTSFTTNITTTTTFYAEASFNGCSSTSRTAVLASTYPSFPVQPGSISGATVNVGGLPGVTYAVSPVANASTYSWTVPGGATITSGQGTNAISVTFGCSATGNITVVASNICGASTPQTIGVSTSLDAPGAISGNAIVCPNSTQTYSVSTIPNAITYTWTVPSGMTLNSGQGTNSITVSVGTSSGNITVTQTSACGTSGATSLQVDNALSSFTYNPSTGIIGGTSVTFSPTSIFSGASYNWTFTSGNPANSTNQNPVVNWSPQVSPTTFNVTLAVNGCNPPTTNSVLVGAGAIFSYTGSQQTFTVPAGITSITVDAQGAQAGLSTFVSADRSGKGGRVQATLPVSPGDVLYIYVGGRGGNSPFAQGGFNGGGAAAQSSCSGGGGGGASDIRLNGTSLNNRIVVAGGGGGASGGETSCTGWTGPGGNGGGLTGQDGSDNQSAPSYDGKGGTQSSGGAAAPSSWCNSASPGSLGQGGAGAGCSNNSGAGGGGGYYGGGGSTLGGAGGGSSYTSPSATGVTHTQGYKTGDGVITITY